MPRTREQVLVAKLDISQFRDALRTLRKEYAEAMKDMLKAYSVAEGRDGKGQKAFRVQLDPKSLRGIQDAFDSIAKGMFAHGQQAGAQYSKGVASGLSDRQLKGVATLLDSIKGSAGKNAEAAGADTGRRFAAGVAKGAKATSGKSLTGDDLSDLDKAIGDKFKAWRLRLDTQLARLAPEAQSSFRSALFQKGKLGIDIDDPTAFFGGSVGPKGGISVKSNELNKANVQAALAAARQYNKDILAEQKQSEADLKRGKDDFSKWQLERLKQDAKAGTAVKAILARDEKASNKAQGSAEQMVASEKVQAAKSYYRYIRDLQKEVDASQDQANKMVLREKIAAAKAYYRYERDLAREVDRSHDQANKMTLQEKIQAAKAYYRYYRDLQKEVDASQDEANKMLLREKIASAKAYYRYVRDLEKENARENAKLGITPHSGISPLTTEQAKMATAGLSDIAEQTKNATKQADGLFKAHKGIGSQLAKTGEMMFKWLVFYRLVRDTMMAVERAISTTVGLSLQYARASEIQKIGLTGVLAENFKITNEMGRQLHGAEALQAVQGEAGKQWNILQSTSLKVVGTTEDLMMLYTGILPHAVKLQSVEQKRKITLEEIQGLTESTAIAAGSLDISFNDARSGIISLLQGRSLMRNRLVSVLGIDKAELDRLKGTPALFDLISSKMKNFAALGAKSQQSLAAMSESLKDYIGRIGSDVLKPFIDLFKHVVNDVQQMFFVDIPGQGLVLKDTIQSSLAIVASSFRTALEPLQKLNHEFAGNGQAVFAWANGISTIGRAVVQAAVWLGELVYKVVDFIAKNRVMLKDLILLTTVLAGLQYFRNMGATLVTMARGSGFLATVLQTLNPLLRNVEASSAVWGRTATNKVQEWTKSATAAKLAGTAVIGLKAALMTLSTAALVGGIVWGITAIIQKIEKMRQEAETASVALDLLMNKKDYVGTIGKAKELLGSDDPAKRREGIGLYGASSRKASGADQLQEFINPTWNVGVLAENGSNILTVIDAVNEKMRAFNVLLDAPDKSKGATERKAAILQQIILMGTAKEKFQEFYQTQILVNAQYKDLDAHIKKLNNDLVEAKKDESLGGLFVDPQGGMDPAKTKESLAAKTKQIQKDLDEAIQTRADMERRYRIASGKLPLTQAHLTLTSNDRPEPVEDMKGGHFVDKTEAARKMAEERYQIKLLEIRKELALDKMSAEEGEDAQVEAERVKNTELLQLWEFRAAALEQYRKRELAAAGGAKAKVETLSAEIEQLREGLKAEKMELERGQQGVLASILESAKKRKESFTAKFVEFNDALAKKSADVWGEQTEVARISMTNFADEIETYIAKNSTLAAGQLASLRNLAVQARAMAPVAQQKQSLEVRLQSAQRITEESRRQQDLLNKSFENGAVSAEVYARRMKELSQSEIAGIRATVAAKEGEMALMLKGAAVRGFKEGGDLGAAVSVSLLKSDPKFTALEKEVDTLLERITELESVSTKAGAAMASWQGLVGSFKTLSSLLDGFTTGLTRTLDLFESILGKANAIGDIISKWRTFMGKFQEYKSVLGGSAGGAFVAMFSGMNLDQLAKVRQQQQAGVGSLSTLTNSIDAGSGIAKGVSTVSADKWSKAIGYIGVVGMVVSAAIQIAAALYKRAVERAKTAISESFNVLSKAMDDGTMTVGNGLHAMEANRQEMVDKYSDSKSGRKALKDLLPDIDKDIAALKKRIKDIQEAFVTNLNGLRAGNGPFGDWYKQLIDLQKSTKEYLDSFVQDSPAYWGALKNVEELYSLTLKNAKASWEEAMRGFESESLSSQQKVFDLLDEQQSIFGQMAQLEQSRVELAQKELDIRKQIAEIMRKAAEDEAAIRRRGVLEAQLSIAEQKAVEIQAIRNKALEDLRAAQKSLEDNKKGASDLDKQGAALATSLETNRIRLEGAQIVADIESEITGKASDRLDIIRRQVELETENARLQVERWKETKELIDAIGNSPYLTKLPTGFPSINVTIGNIVITTDLSQTNTSFVPSSVPSPSSPYDDLRNKQLEDWLRRFPGSEGPPITT